MGQYSPESPGEMSPDTMSPLYPDRPIRPLPKRRLRERLSPSVAETITYPPAPPTTTPLFYYPYTLSAEDDRTRDGRYTPDRQRADEIEHNYISRRNVQEVDSDEDFTELAYRSRYSRQSPDTSGRSFRYVQKPESSKYPNPEPPASTTSSADGYDSFENTNNKKKRKIPTPGDGGLNGIHLSNELAALGISAPTDEKLLHEDTVNGGGQYCGTGGTATSGSSHGMSGPGRGRYGRVRNGRSPLRTLSDAPNNWLRTPKTKQPQWSPQDSPGIISTAIANAEKTPVTPSRGQENVSLLHEQASKKSTPASTQFTFTCDSQVPGTVAWPGPKSPTSSMNQSQATKGMQITQQRSMGTQASQASSALPVNSRQAPKSNGKQIAHPKKSRRSAAKEYLIAARRRREDQEYQNFHHPRSPEDQWICEFCEYELIFGTPPEALIRQYEIKARRLRKQDAERQRLLEKAKLRGRKGKKGGKVAAAKNIAATQDRQVQHQHSQQATSHSQTRSQGTQSEEYYEDEYDEDYAQDEPLASPVNAAVPRRQVNEVSDAKKPLGGKNESAVLHQVVT